MHRNQRKQHARGKRSNSKRIQNFRSPRSGNATNPPDNSGMVQIPRPLAVRQVTTRRTFKVDYMLTTGTTAPIVFVASLYDPFYVINYPNPGTAASTAPASLTNFYAAFGLYKVKRIQAILQPMITAMNIPAPYTVAMVFDASQTSLVSLSSVSAADIQNSTKVSTSAPSEINYDIPKLSGTGIANEIVLSGGWTTSTPPGTLANNGNLLITQSSPISVSTTYSTLTLVYEIWFKNPL